MSAVVQPELQNPYWEIVQTFPNSDLRWNRSKFTPEPNPDVMERVFQQRHTFKPLDIGKINHERTRSHLVKTYAWAIPSDETIHWMVEKLNGQAVVEIGAGLGYWAWLLDQAGVQITAYDKVLIAQNEENSWFEAGQRTFFPVYRGDAQIAAQYPDRALFLCWPPYNAPFAFDALTAYQGDTLFFCGEQGGCTGDDSFFELLSEEWDEVDCCEQMIQWGGMHDWLWKYERKVEIIREES